MAAVGLRDIRGYLTVRCCVHANGEKRGERRKK